MIIGANAVELEALKKMLRPSGRPPDTVAMDRWPVELQRGPIFLGHRVLRVADFRRRM